MKNLLAMIAAGLGAAGVMYYFDPDSGRARRARLAGLLGTSRGDGEGPAWQTQGREVSDARLRERVRLRIDDLVSHPAAIHVQVDNRVVRLSGRVLATEMHGLLTQVRDMPGVRRVINAMAALDSPQALAGLRVPAAQTP